MAFTGSLLLLLSCFCLSEAIRTLKEGPMIDAEGREYKSLKIEAEILPRPDTRSAVHIQCTAATMIILVKADLYNNGQFLSPEELLLGGAQHSGDSQCLAYPASDSEYVIEAGLQDCGSKLTISGDSVIYSNNLIVLPAANYLGITRTSEAVVPVSCHYKSSSAYPEKGSVFSLKLMTDDWRGASLSSVFYLGDLLHLEASYNGPDLRQLFISSCVITMTPNPTSLPRYYFLHNNGCLTDAKQQGSKALFLPRKRANALQLQLDAFLFQQDPRNSIYITCQLKATSDMWRSSRTNKACNFVHSR
ncbi:zona pellucida sperm-binding protein 3-like [Aulostomus maculatus]